MAQFNIYELGGCGQWMRGGMTMVGDMFNYQLKSKVDGICSDLSNAIVDQNLQVVPPPPPQKSGSGMRRRRTDGRRICGQEDRTACSALAWIIHRRFNGQPKALASG